MSDRPTTFEALIPAVPDGLILVLDDDGDAWQRQGENRWVCTKAKVPGLLGGAHSTEWRHLVYAFGPLTAVHWDETR
jgi:hypothetical protein